MTHGFLLLNLGTPNAPTSSAVRSYLKEFLLDKRIISLPAWLRYLLVYGLILPTRPSQSAKAYKEIWTDKGSPLLTNSLDLIAKLKKKLPEKYITIGMSYGRPSIEEAVAELSHCEKITIIPLFPQYSSAATGASIEKTLKILSKQTYIPSLTLINSFYDHPAFIQAQSEIIQPYLNNYDHLLFSYHGIPENQLQCHKICESSCLENKQAIGNCYRRQCFQTSNLLAQALQIPQSMHTTAFQSRLGKTPWIKPYTDHVLSNLASRGIKNLLIACPSFVADCLETLEEIGIRAKRQWQELGGSHLKLIPSLNSNQSWVDALISIANNS